MRRRHTPSELNILRKRRKLRESFERRMYGEYEPRAISRKRHPFDCGNPKCGLCHIDKKFGHEETKQEWESKLKEKDDN